MIIKKNFIMILSLLIIPLIGVLMLIPLGSSSYNYSGYIKEYPNIKENMFVRVINNSEFIIDEVKSEIIFKSLKIKTDFLKPINKDKKYSNKLIN